MIGRIASSHLSLLFYSSVLTKIASPGRQYYDVSGKITDQIHDKVSPIITKMDNMSSVV